MNDRDHDRFHDLLRLAVAAEPPLGLHAEELAAAGRRRLHRRRAGFAATGLAVVGLAMAGIAVAPGGTSTPPALPPADTVTAPSRSYAAVPAHTVPAGLPKRAVPTVERIDAEVRGVLGDAMPPADGGAGVPDPSVVKREYRLDAATKLHLVMRPAGELAEEQSQAKQDARQLCVTFREQPVDEGAWVAVAERGSHRFVVAVGARLHVWLTVDGTWPAAEIAKVAHVLVRLKT